jgi:putative tricarboxylic transport membrane protein
VRVRESPGAYPRETLNWTIAFGPGGGNDVMARTLIEILQRYHLYEPPIVAQNRPAGSGAAGWGYVYKQAGNPYHISTTSGSFITTPLFASTPWKPTSFTPVALLATDDVLLVVDRRSGVRSLEQFVERAKAATPTIGGMGTAQVNFIVPHLLARAAGFEFRYVPFNSQGELTTALLSRSIDAAATSPGAVLSGAAAPAALAGVPTLREKGFEDITISMPRGVILPPGVPREVRDWWIGTIKRVVETPEWKQYLAAQLLTEDVRYGDDFAAYLDESSAVFGTLLRELGVIR